MPSTRDDALEQLTSLIFGNIEEADTTLVAEVIIGTAPVLEALGYLQIDERTWSVLDRALELMEADMIAHGAVFDKDGEAPGYCASLQEVASVRARVAAVRDSLKGADRR